MNVSDAPEGWHRLRALAQSAPDAHSLALIVDEMNLILDQHLEEAESEPYHAANGRNCHPVIGLEVQASQYD